ncbi:hypothetical protein BGY98DRAFT_983562, partial [Russula aff. rugulosa BPL654]
MHRRIQDHQQGRTQVRWAALLYLLWLTQDSQWTLVHCRQQVTSRDRYKARRAALLCLNQDRQRAFSESAMRVGELRRVVVNRWPADATTEPSAGPGHASSTKSGTLARQLSGQVI